MRGVKVRSILYSVVSALVLFGAVFFSGRFFPEPSPVRRPENREVHYNRVPILLFHNLDGKGQYSVTRKDFRDQLEEIRSRGLHVIPLRELIEASRENRLLDHPSVVITIDDDFENIGRVAAPLLREYGYPATLFVYIKDINNHPVGGLSWDDLRRLHSEGFEIQNHSWTHGVFHHPRKKESDRDYHRRVDREIVESRKILEEKIPGNRIYAFAYPMGYTSPYLERRLVEEGYEILLTTDARPVDLTRPFTGVFDRFTIEEKSKSLNRILYHHQLEIAATPFRKPHPGEGISTAVGFSDPAGKKN